MIKLTCKNEPFIWIDDCEKSFQILKEKLITTPILTLPEGLDGFVVYTDSLHLGLGVVLMQSEKVVSYASRKLKIHEKNTVFMI